MVEYAVAKLDDTYSALAHDVRRGIVLRLLEGEHRVTDLAQAFPMTLAAVSKHVRVLEAAGLVQRRVEGRIHWLSLDPVPLEAAERWIGRTRRFWETRLDALEALVGSEPGDR